MVENDDLKENILSYLGKSNNRSLDDILQNDSSKIIFLNLILRREPENLTCIKDLISI